MGPGRAASPRRRRRASIAGAATRRPAARCTTTAPGCARGHRQVKRQGDGEAPKLARAANLRGSLGASDLGPDRERLRADGSVVGGRKVIAVQVEEVVDLVVGGEEPLRLAG